MNKIQKMVTPVLVIALGIGAYALLHAAKPEPEKKQEAPRALSVFVEPVERADVELQVNSQGTVRPRTEIAIVSQVAGRITAVSTEFTEGGVVEPGTSLIKIESTDYELALSQAEARVAEADFGVQQAKADADVAYQQLRNESGASDLALKKPQLAGAKARLKAANADLQLARINLSRTSIALPFKGRVTSTLVNVGQYVTPGMTLGRAFATDVVEIRLPLADSQLASLGLPIGYIATKKGGPSVALKATVAGQVQHWTGRLVRLDAAIDSDTRMLYGIAEVIDPYGSGASQHKMPLAVGLYVDATIAGRTVANEYLVSRQALRAGSQLYVVDGRGHLDIRKVQVTHSTSEDAVIASGLNPGDQVVISSIRNPIQGMALEAMHQASAEPDSVAKSESTDVESLQPANEGG